MLPTRGQGLSTVFFLSLVLVFSHLSPHWPVQLYFLFRLKLVVNTLKLDVTYLISSFSQKIGKLRNIVSHFLEARISWTLDGNVPQFTFFTALSQRPLSLQPLINGGAETEQMSYGRVEGRSALGDHWWTSSILQASRGCWTFTLASTYFLTS